ncbi:uncharacterized protein LOC127482132 [Manacus candei]|uniref:uncharacterized protein LOC127482132 n=1 Tax=Manacus candei TaxID=415023 RepID=UPI002228035F|nr:uncharacterized protein LOC127482132 [Manacus candei]
MLGAGLPILAVGMLQGNNSPYGQDRKPETFGFQVQLVGQPGHCMGSKSSLCWYLLSGRNPRLYSILGLGLAISVQDSCKRTTALSPRQESAYPQSLRCSWWASLGTPWAATSLCPGTFCLAAIFIRMQFWESDCQFQRRIPKNEQQPFSTAKRAPTLLISGAGGGPAWALLKQQELSGVLPFVWEESSSVFNFGRWTAPFGSRSPARSHQPFSPGRKALTFLVSRVVGGPAWTLAGQQELCVVAPLVWEESSSVCNVGTWTGTFGTGLKKDNNSHYPEETNPGTSGFQVQLVGQPGHCMGSKSFLWWHLLSWWNPHPYSILGVGLAIAAQDSCT